MINSIKPIKTYIDNNSNFTSGVNRSRELIKKTVSGIVDLSKSRAFRLSNYENLPKTPTFEEISFIISKLKENKKLTKTEQLQLFWKIEKNNPAFSIFTKLSRWDYFETIIFSWVKELNDNTSQSFTDKVILRFKNYLLKTYPWVEVVWNDYKNFTLRTSKNLILSKSSLNILLQKALRIELANNTKYNWKVFPGIINVSNKKWKVWWNTQEEVLYDIAHIRMQLERQSFKTEVLKKREIRTFEKNLFSKYFNTKWKSLDYINVGWDEFFVKNNVLYKEFIVNWVKKTEKTPIFLPDWKFCINFITKVRKKEIPTKMNLYIDSKKLIDSYIWRWEFIAPIIKEKNLSPWQMISQHKLNKYQELKSKISNWNLTELEVSILEYLSENTYKTALDKESFYSKITWPWAIFYIDIKDMWSINIKDFSDKISAWNDSKISTKDIIIKSWEYMTQRFQYLFVKLNTILSELYPWNDIFVSIWWDEMMIYVKWASKNNLNNSQDFINYLFKSLDSLSLEWRITHKYLDDNDLNLWWEYIVEELDILTQKTKAIEKRISSIKNNIIVSFWENINQEERENINQKLYNLSLLENFSLTIENWVEYIIFHSNPFEELWSKLELSSIIDDNLFLRPNPPSPFTKFLDEHWLWRIKNRN